MSDLLPKRSAQLFFLSLSIGESDQIVPMADALAAAGTAMFDDVLMAQKVQLKEFGSWKFHGLSMFILLYCVNVAYHQCLNLYVYT